MPWYRFGSRRVHSRERDEEMRAHLELYAEELVARGWSRDDARREARLKFGNPRVKLEEVDALNRIPLIETLGRDLRTAFRGLRAAPAFTAVVLTVLTLAMGATTAVFSVVDAVVLRALPFDEGDRLVAVDRTVAGKVVMSPFSAPEFLALRAQPEVFEGLAAVTDGNVTLRRDGGNDPEILRGQRVSAEFFSVLRTRPALGRAFTTEHEVEGRGRVAVISHGFWQRRYGRSSDVLGKRLPATGGDFEILGVMPSGFGYPVGAIEPVDLWVPYVVPSNERVNIVGSYLRLIARLKDGTTLQNAQGRIDEIAASNVAVASGAGPNRPPTLRDLRESLTGYTRAWMLMLLASVSCVLLIACVNIANLLLVRATVRVRELSVRAALGATRWELCRMLLVESLVLATVGTAMGTLGAWWGIGALRSLLPPDMPRLANIAIDWRVLVVSAGAALVTGVAFGLPPAFYCSRTIDHVLKQNGRADTASGRRQWLRTTFLVAQVALAVVLLVGAALFLTSFARLMRIDIGLDYHNVLVVDVHPRPAASGAAGTEARKANAARLANLLKRMSEIPGVVTAAMATDNIPFSLRTSSSAFGIPGRELPPDQGGIGSSYVSPDYFRALGVPLLRGRFFTAADWQGSDLVAILNEAAARTYFPNQDPVGQVVALNGKRTIVGVVGDVRGFGPERIVQRAAFVPGGQGELTGGTVILKTAGSSTSVVPQVKAAIWSEFPDIAIPAARTLEQGFGRLIAERRFSMLLLSLFGVLGVMIAGVGIYGVMTYVVTQRTREIGIRMALGALSSTILWSVLRRASTQVAAGVLVGLGTAWLLATSVEKFLFRVEPHDLRLYAAVCTVLAATALTAAFVPARRAARVDPVIALRLE
jgi:putative ABC transport system permease protein